MLPDRPANRFTDFQGDSGAYRSRVNVGIGASGFGRTTTSGGSGLPSCRNSYSTVGSASTRLPAKERVSGFGNAFLKKDKHEEKSSFKYPGKLFCILRFGYRIGLLDDIDNKKEILNAYKLQWK